MPPARLKRDSSEGRRVAPLEYRLEPESDSGITIRSGPQASRPRLLLPLVPLLPDLAAGGVEAEQDLELGVGLRRARRTAGSTGSGATAPRTARG